ncbi:TVP38/TMEM64 family protein [Phytohalomonas tamaricis]|uniref:TVP38/TMEM64 family protein n=1 Tax=Phytohalomonas tamaricis TaxID=2081032 RepID=UPI000D0B9BE3|nr:TVP38/TMEM64 family protein [Phytohalomonas tamaricis]
MPRRLWLLVLIVVVMAVLGGVWQWLAMGDNLTPETLQNVLAETMYLRNTVWAPMVLMVIYVVASIVVFPLTILVGTTGLIFGPWLGLAYGLTGTMLASMSTYWLGRKLGRDTLVRYGGQRINKLADALANRGIRTMIVFNLLPLAPFTFTNMIAGACHLRFRAYMIGSFIGILPGLAAVTVAGSQLGSLLQTSSLSNVLLAAGAVAVAAAVLLTLRHLAQRRES